MTTDEALITRLILRGFTEKILAGRNAVKPDSGDYIHLDDTGGMRPVGTLVDPLKIRRPSLKVTCATTGDYNVAHQFAQRVLTALCSVTNTRITSDASPSQSAWFLTVRPLGDVYDDGPDGKQRARASFNILCQRQE